MSENTISISKLRDKLFEGTVSIENFQQLLKRECNYECIEQGGTVHFKEEELIELGDLF